jgi:hypothetical protein
MKLTERQRGVIVAMAERNLHLRRDTLGGGQWLLWRLVTEDGQYTKQDVAHSTFLVLVRKGLLTRENNASHLTEKGREEANVVSAGAKVPHSEEVQSIGTGD